MKLIGKGSFTKAYLLDNGKVQLESVCSVKECMSLGWFPESYLFPEVERVSSAIYSMEYYPKVSSIKNNVSARQWRLYKALRKIYRNSWRLAGEDRFTLWHRKFDEIPSEFRKERETLKEALDSLGNFGLDFGFEISPRNIATKGNKLVLLDCFFKMSTLNACNSASLNQRINTAKAA